MFVFRNNTIEGLFPEGTQYSGYSDISLIPQGESILVWFYQVPVSFEREKQLAEVEDMTDKLGVVMSSVDPDSTLIIVSLENVFDIKYNESDNRLSEAVHAFNENARAISRVNPKIKYLDFGSFLREYPADQLINWKYYFISQMILSPSLTSPFQAWWNRQMEIMRGNRKKCLILDLDNTLWGGVLGEDGITGIKIGGDYPGKAFLYFQEALKTLEEQGVILTVCSKNNEADVVEAWKKNPFMILTEKDFSSWEINWDNKADNIRRLAEKLNIGLDSMVFIDDNPTERELVHQQLPMVSVPEFPKRPYELPSFFRKLVDDYFTAYHLTEEDYKKTEQYKANALRATAQKKYTDLSDFIRSLDIHLEIQPLNEFNLPRMAQMTQKTNQFNLTTRRYTETDILSIVGSGGKAYCLSVKDKYGDSGITGEMLFRIDGNIAEIDTLLLSCRILGKRIENAFVLSVLDKLRKDGIRFVKAEYHPTKKNGQVADFYDRIGLLLVEKRTDGSKIYEAEIEQLPKPEALYNITWK